MKSKHLPVVFIILLLLTVPLHTVLSSTAQLILSGTIGAADPTLSLSITTTETATALDFSITTYAQDVATLNATQENSTAYNVFVSSENNFHLAQSSQTEYTIPYTLIAYGGNTFNSGSTGGLVQGPISWDNEWGLAVQVEQAPSSSHPSGTYTDTLTFSIEAN